MRGYKRRKYVVDKRYQGKFTLTVIGFCAFGMLVALGIFNYLAYRKFESVMWRVHIDESTIGELIKSSLIYSNVIALVLTALILIAFSRFVLLKTAPPLFRLNRHIEKAAGGNLTSNLDWVQNDEFKETAEELNRMVSSLRDKFRVVKDRGKDVQSVSNILGYVMDKPDLADEKCRLLADSLRSLRDALSKVKAA
ncbi:MAG: methyl-accepting chemotaxis protein [Thermodesulfovibrionales bacterium]|nr:methyl-accepting chemotaxis protein [Thermodesulfovibrionales bacterium]